MIFARALVGQELILLGTIGLAIGLVVAHLRQRGQLDLLRRVWLATVLWAIFGTLDALVTMVGTWGAPWREANTMLRAMLSWDGWIGQLIYTFGWVLFWAAVVLGLEELRRRLSGVRLGGVRVWVYLLGATQLVILYTLAVEHLSGFLSWTPYLQPIMPLIAWLDARAPWLFANSPMVIFVNYALILGAIFTALQLAITALLRRRSIPAPVPVARQAPERAAQPAQITER